MKVLFVCTGNTCRSPMAEMILRAKGVPGVEVASRGLVADGSPMSENAVTVLREIGLEPGFRVSQPLTFADLDAADRVICLSVSHRAALEHAGVSPKKLFVLGTGISDPFGGDVTVYRRCRDEIIEAIDQLIRRGLFLEYSVKPIEQKHFSAVARLEKICFSEPWTEEGLLESYRHGTRFFVAESLPELMGYVGVTVVADEAYITNVAVMPAFRHQGVATALMEQVFAYCREKGCAFVSLEVRVSNTDAIALYEKTGFVQAGRRKDFYRDPREDAWVMTRYFEKEQNHEDTGH
ncbi:MAG: ribosomal protein S18-alanine N-acetyltransferase [Clostridia bacterium]|nr:ribosomal protein S18-alanine N-acetyltransferase [Clostridia bacterium]